MKKKIIFFLQNFTPGGAEKNLINYANYLTYNNFDVYLLIISKKGILRKKIDKKIKIIYLNKQRLLFSVNKIINIINIIKPDFLFSTLVHFSLLLSFLKRYGFIKSKLIIRPSNIIFINTKSNFNLTRFFINLLVKKFLKYGDYFFCISQEIKKEIELLKIEKKKIIKIDNAIIDKDFYKNSKIPLRKNILKKNDYIISIGRLDEQKNHLMLINAFSKVKKKYNKKIILVIIGEGHLREKILRVIKEKKIQKDVIILKNKLNVLNFINYSKLFLQTSLWEGQPNVLMEAIFLNKQVIATKCPGQNHLYLSKFKNCHLLKRNSVNNLADKILYFLKNKNKTKVRYKENNFKQFKIENSAKKIIYEIQKN